MKQLTMGLDTYPDPVTFDMDSELKSRTRDSALSLGFAAGMRTPDPEVPCELESGPSTPEEKKCSLLQLQCLHQNNIMRDNLLKTAAFGKTLVSFNFD